MSWHRAISGAHRFRSVITLGVIAAAPACGDVAAPDASTEARALPEAPEDGSPFVRLAAIDLLSDGDALRVALPDVLPPPPSSWIRTTAQASWCTTPSSGAAPAPFVITSLSVLSQNLPPSTSSRCQTVPDTSIARWLGYSCGLVRIEYQGDVVLTDVVIVADDVTPGTGNGSVWLTSDPAADIPDDARAELGLSLGATGVGTLRPGQDVDVRITNTYRDRSRVFVRLAVVARVSELCNGLDDDCDGLVDEGDVCAP